MEAYQATIEDLEGISNLFNLYRVFYKKESNLESAKEYIYKRLENEDSVIFFVKINNKYVGFTQLYPAFSSVSMKKTWILNDLYVDTEAREQGVGEILLNKAKNYSIKTGADSISLITALDNISAQRLYEKNGYEKNSQFYQYKLNLN